MKKKLLGKNQNLVSIDEPYGVMAHLLKDLDVTGIIDAGASDGRISKRLLRKFPSANIYAFEPNPLYTQTLQQYAKEERRFHPYFLALSDHEGNADLHVTDSPGNTSLFTPGKRLKQMDTHGASVKSLEKVKVVTIDEWAKRNDDPAIQLMKFDIQAAELKRFTARCVSFRIRHYSCIRKYGSILYTRKAQSLVRLIYFFVNTDLYYTIYLNLNMALMGLSSGEMPFF